MLTHPIFDLICMDVHISECTGILRRVSRHNRQNQQEKSCCRDGHNSCQSTKVQRRIACNLISPSYLCFLYLHAFHKCCPKVSISCLVFILHVACWFLMNHSPLLQIHFCQNLCVCLLDSWVKVLAVHDICTILGFCTNMMVEKIVTFFTSTFFRNIHPSYKIFLRKKKSRVR